MAIWLENLKNAAIVITPVVGLYTILRGLADFRASTEQKKQDLRWKRAAAARELTTEIHKSTDAAAAIEMFDWWCCARSIKVDDVRIDMKPDDATNALALPAQNKATAEQMVIRDCFDWFFYYVDRIGHYVRSGLIDLGDVYPIFKPYARIVNSNREVFYAFLDQHDYDSAKWFFDQY